MPRMGEWNKKISNARSWNNNLLLTEREGRTGEYWPEVVAVRQYVHLPAFESNKYATYDRFHGNGPYSEIPTKKEPIRTLGFALPYNNC